MRPVTGLTAADAPTAVAIAMTYPSADALRRDRLGDEAYGLLVRTQVPLLAGGRVAVTLTLEDERITLRIDGQVRWLTPLVSGALAGIVLEPESHRQQVQLDLAFGRRTTGGPLPAPPSRTAALAVPPDAPPPALAARPLSVAMLLPDRVLRSVLIQALARFGREKGNWAVGVDAVGDADAFLAALAAHHRGLAVIDCDPLGAAAEPLVTAIRSHAGWARLPVILLASTGGARIRDAHAASLQKPVAVKSFVDLAAMLVGGEHSGPAGGAPRAP